MIRCRKGGTSKKIRSPKHRPVMESVKVGEGKVTHARIRNPDPRKG